MWFSPGPPVSSTDNTDRHEITEILLKASVKTINPNLFVRGRFHTSAS